MLKKIGQTAREEIEAVTGMKCFLDLHVDVDAKWQERFGSGDAMSQAVAL